MRAVGSMKIPVRTSRGGTRHGAHWLWGSRAGRVPRGRRCPLPWPSAPSLCPRSHLPEPRDPHVLPCRPLPDRGATAPGSARPSRRRARRPVPALRAVGLRLRRSATAPAGSYPRRRTVPGCRTGRDRSPPACSLIPAHDLTLRTSAVQATRSHSGELLPPLRATVERDPPWLVRPEVPECVRVIRTSP